VNVLLLDAIDGTADSRAAVRQLVEHLRSAEALVRAAVIRLSPADAAELVNASSAFMETLTQRRGARRA
jgi:hypothetical protein